MITAISISLYAASVLCGFATGVSATKLKMTRSLLDKDASIAGVALSVFFFLLASSLQDFS